MTLTTQVNKDRKTTSIWRDGILTIVPTKADEKQHEILARLRKVSGMCESERLMYWRNKYSREV